MTTTRYLLALQGPVADCEQNLAGALQALALLLPASLPAERTHQAQEVLKIPLRPRPSQQP